MPKKKSENLVLEANPKRYSFKQPKGIDLDAIAKNIGVSKSALIRNALIEYLDKHQIIA